MTCIYRGHGAVLAIGARPDQVSAERIAAEAARCLAN